MVSFSCEACGDVLTKKKLDPHRHRCHGATFTCLDCMVHFTGVQYRSHTSCISEDQKYQGALYKDKNKKPKHNKPADKRPAESPKSTMALQPYVEDVGEDRDYETWNDSAAHTQDEGPLAEPSPEAPVPPAAAAEEHVNVFDFLVAADDRTLNASNRNSAGDQPGLDVVHSTSLVRYDYSEGNYLDPTSLMDADDQPLVQYGTGPVPIGSFVTPAPKGERRRAKDAVAKKDKKRKRLHVDVPGDQVMTDAPPVLHSGLTGGLKGLMRPTLPPSPDYSGGDVADTSPASPLKKTKHSKHSKNGRYNNNILDIMTGGSKAKAPKKTSSKKHSHRRQELKNPKLLEFGLRSNDRKKDSPNGQIIVFKPRADAFFSFVTKGPESERGGSMNKTLKRYHREREALGSSLTKDKEEKELWKDLRLRRNDRGEVVLFSL